jgi:UDP-glucose 4-epimerase
LRKINNTDRPLAKLTKRQRENIKINKIKNEKGDITDTEEIQRIIRSYSKKSVLHKIGKSKQNGQFS